VMVIDSNEAIVKPGFVFSIDRPGKLMELLPRADAVVVACPLTKESKGMFGKEQIAALKKTAYFVNVAHADLVDESALLAALAQKNIAGAGLDVTNPDPFILNRRMIREIANLVVAPQIADESDGARDRQWRLFRENVRRFVAGEPLLCVVDKQKGY